MLSAAAASPPLYRFAVGMWALLIISSAPAVYLSQGIGGPLGGWFHAVAFIVGSYLPWMLATPALWALCRRWPLGLGRDLRHIGSLLLLGAGMTPALSALGWILGAWMAQLHPWGSLPSAAVVARAIAVTALFAAPTFVAVVGIGQTLAFVQRYRLRGALLEQARQEALRQHLQHHFLFNALNAIGGLGYQRPADADRALARLSDLLRDAMACAAQRALADEVAAANDYLDLQRLLRDVPLQVDWQVVGTAWRCAVPGLLLQPLLENAVRHSGWEQGTAALDIRVRAERIGARLHLSVHNGCGLAGRSPPAGSGTGLRNLHQRLQSLYGERAVLDARPLPDGFRVDVQVPV